MGMVCCSGKCVFVCFVLFCGLLLCFNLYNGVFVLLDFLVVVLVLGCIVLVVW